MRDGQWIQVEKVGDVFSWKFTLSFGLHIEHTESDTMKIADEDGRIFYAEFEGLIIRLPFVEIRIGSIWTPTLPTQTQQEDLQEK